MITPDLNDSKSARLPTLDEVIAWIESSSDQYAYRFEPLRYNERRAVAPNVLRQIVRLHHCTDESARVIYASSYGLFQVMGFNLFWPPLLSDFTFGEYLADRNLQVDTFFAFVRFHDIDFTVTQLKDRSFAERFARIYNGSSAYADRIAASLQHFGVSST